MTLAYYTFRGRIAGDIRLGLINPTIAGIFEASQERAGLGPAHAAEWTERFMQDLQRHRERRRRDLPAGPARDGSVQSSTRSASR